MTQKKQANHLEWFGDKGFSDSSMSNETGGIPVPNFRLDNEQLSFRFTATLSDRGGEHIERLPTPPRLDEWFVANSVRLTTNSATDEHLELARQLREVIHRVGTAVALNSAPSPVDIACLNRLSRDSGTYPELIGAGMRWSGGSNDPIRASLGIVAQDAIAVFGGDLREHVKTCQNPECGGLYVDTSRGQNRRWCSMNTCGNRAKKAQLRRNSG